MTLNHYADSLAAKIFTSAFPPLPAAKTSQHQSGGGLTYEKLCTAMDRLPPAPLPLKITASALCVEQFRFPRSKKIRIRRKWEKRPGNFRPSRRAFMVEAAGIRHLYAHPQFISEVLRGITL